MATPWTTCLVSIGFRERMVSEPVLMGNKQLLNICIKAYLAEGEWAWSLCKEQKHFSCFHPPRHWSHYPTTKGRDWCWCLKMKPNSITHNTNAGIKHPFIIQTGTTKSCCSWQLPSKSKHGAYLLLNDLPLLWFSFASLNQPDPQDVILKPQSPLWKKECNL